MAGGAAVRQCLGFWGNDYWFNGEIRGTSSEFGWGEKQK
jgi:hypothetical protein